MSTDPMDNLHKQLFDEGLKVRKEVLGDEYVDRALQKATAFSKPAQELITEVAWGTIWQRPGLDRKQRSLLSECSPPTALSNPTETVQISEGRMVLVKSADQHNLIDLGIIIAQKAWYELVLHTRGAINNGLSEIEIREAVLQATVYCGTPSGVEAIAITEKTINEMIEKGEYKRPEA